MDELSDFDNVQRRIKKRQNKRNVFYLWLGVFIIFLSVVILANDHQIWNFSAPFLALTGLFTGIRGVQFYALRPRVESEGPLIEQEMGWLFSEQWELTTNEKEYSYAQERIRKRKLDRWLFLVILIVSIVGTGWLALIAVGTSEVVPNSALANGLFATAVIWTLLVIWRGIYVFPTKERLVSRERTAGEAIRREFSFLHPSKSKHVEKQKRTTPYVIGDDGELMPTSTLLASSADKSKQKQSQHRK